MSWSSSSSSSRSSTITLGDPFYPTHTTRSFPTPKSLPLYPNYDEPYNSPYNSKTLSALIIGGFVCILLSIVVCVLGCVYRYKQKSKQKAAEVAISQTLAQMAETGAGQPSVALASSTHQPQYRLQLQPLTRTDGTQVYSVYIPPGYTSPPAGDELVLVPKRLLSQNTNLSQSDAATYVLPQPQPAQSPLQHPKQPLTAMQRQKQRQASTEMGIEEIQEESRTHLGNAASASSSSSSSSSPPDPLIQSQQSGRQSPGAGVSSRVSASGHEMEVADLAIKPVTDVETEKNLVLKTEV